LRCGRCETDRDWDRLGGLFGLIALILFGLADGVALPLPPPELSRSAPSLDRYFAGKSEGLHAVGVLEGLATFCLLVFFVAVWSRLRRFDTVPALPSALALAGGVAFTALNWVWCACMVAIAYVTNAGTPNSVRLLWDLSGTIVTTLDFPGALWFAGVAAALLGRREVPAWLGWGALVAGAACLLGGLAGAWASGGFLSPNGGYFQLLPAGLGFLWFAAASVHLLRGE
jgi:hypothetical protein